MNPTKTINRIHFNDLDPYRFEDLCRQLIFPLKPWTQISHFGRAGSELGVDIRGEYYDEGVKKIWDVQCKRYKAITIKQLKDIIIDYLKNNKNVPDCYVLILGCVLSRTNYEKITQFAKEEGLAEILIWDSSYLETILYGRHPDLLFAYFEISINHRNLINVAKIEHRLKLKQQVETLLLPYYDNPQIRKKVIIHNINYDTYPIADDRPGISSWFWLEYFRPYFKGISFYMQVVDIKIDLHLKKWSLCEKDVELPENFIKISAYRIGNIPYDNIIDFDVMGDEYYSFPHFYCEFNNLGEPYEEIWYQPVQRDVVFKLNSDLSVWFS
jgi:hypothetical protein